MIISQLNLRSYSLTVFSPSGKLVQIEHALAAVSQGTTSLGIKGMLFSLIRSHIDLQRLSCKHLMVLWSRPRKSRHQSWLTTRCLRKLRSYAPISESYTQAWVPIFASLFPRRGRVHKHIGKSTENTHRRAFLHRSSQPWCNKRHSRGACRASDPHDD